MGNADRKRGSARSLWACCVLLAACGDGVEPVVEPSDGGSRPEKIAFILSFDKGELWLIDPPAEDTPGAPTPVPELIDTGVTTIDWSPDGRYLAATAREGLRVIDLDSAKRSVILPTDSGRFHDVRWSPDGSRLAFERHTPGVGVEIWTVAVDGSGARNASGAAGGAEALAPDWSRDGRYVTYMKQEPGAGRWETWVAAFDGSSRRVIPRPGDAMHPRWSPRDDLIAFHDRHTVWIVRSDGSNPRSLCGSEENLFPHWSRDGDGLVFYSRGTIHHVKLDGAACTRLADVEWPNVDWSRDSKRLVFTTNPSGGGHLRLWTVNVETLVITPLIQMPGVVLFPLWRP